MSYRRFKMPEIMRGAATLATVATVHARHTPKRSKRSKCSRAYFRIACAAAEVRAFACCVGEWTNRNMARAGRHGIARGKPTRLRHSMQWAFEHEGTMSENNTAAENENATTVVVNDPEDMKGQSGPPMPTTHHHRGNSQ